jgi:hypothetical protein
MTKPVICQNCHAEMEPGKKTRTRVMEYTEYTCPNCGSVWSEPKPLRGHAPRSAVIVETEADAERLADELLEELVVEEAEPIPKPKRKRKAAKSDESLVAEEAIESEDSDGG